MEVPPLVSFRSVSAVRDKELCPYGYEWGKFGCRRAIYNPVQKPGMIHNAFGLKPWTPRTKRTPYTLPTLTVTTAKPSRNDNGPRQADPYRSDPANEKPPRAKGLYASDFGVWTVNKPQQSSNKEPNPKPKSMPMPKQEVRDTEVNIFGDISEETPLPKWEPKWKRKPKTKKNYFHSKVKFNPNNF